MRPPAPIRGARRCTICRNAPDRDRVRLLDVMGLRLEERLNAVAAAFATKTGTSVVAASSAIQHGRDLRRLAQVGLQGQAVGRRRGRRARPRRPAASSRR
jgi:hypothetical protein